MAIDFTKFRTNVQNFFDDVSTLDVLTLTGQLKFDTTKVGKDGKIKLDNLTGNLLGLLEDASDLSIVAITHYEVDCDSVAYFQRGGSEELIKLHHESVKAAMEARNSMAQMVASFVPKLPL